MTESYKELVFNEITKELPLTQVEKLKSLSEGIEFVDEEDFTSRITTLRENYFPSNKAAPKTGIDLVEGVQEGEIKKETSGRMNQYVKHLSKVKSN
jgi:rRNA maturation protein Rpf1